MDSSLVSFRRMMDQADANMKEAIEKMSLSKFRYAYCTFNPSSLKGFE